VLVDELSAYRIRISEDRHDSFANDACRQPHDDLVLAAALATYIADRRIGGKMTWGGIQQPIPPPDLAEI